MCRPIDWLLVSERFHSFFYTLAPRSLTPRHALTTRRPLGCSSIHGPPTRPPYQRSRPYRSTSGPQACRHLTAARHSPCSCTTRVTRRCKKGSSRHWLYRARAAGHPAHTRQPASAGLQYTYQQGTESIPGLDLTPHSCTSLLSKRHCCAERSIYTIARRDPAY